MSLTIDVCSYKGREGAIVERRGQETLAACPRSYNRRGGRQTHVGFVVCSFLSLLINSVSLPGLRLSKPPSLPMPSLFTDPLYTRSSHWTLSTSAVFSSHLGVYGWGEVVPNGFGVAYVTGFDGVFSSFHLLMAAHERMSSTVDFLQFTITSRAEMPNAEFAKEIEKAAEEFYQLFAGSSPASEPRSSRDERGAFSANL